MQAGTEFAMVSCFRRRSWGGEMTFYEMPFTRATASPGDATPLLGERLEGVRSSLLVLVPFSWWGENEMQLKTLFCAKSSWNCENSVVTIPKLLFWYDTRLKNLDTNTESIPCQKTKTTVNIIEYDRA